MTGGGGGEESSHLLEVHLEGELVASKCNAQGLVGGHIAPTMKGQREASSLNQKVFPRPASVLSPVLGSVAMLKSGKVCRFGGPAS